MTQGYGVTCDAGDLYTRRCYDKDGHEIIAYTSKGQPIGFDDKSGKTYLTALDSGGNAYSPYPQGMPYTLNDSGAISDVAGKWRLSSGADPQWITRLLTLPGAQARIRAATTTVPWYYDVFGLRKQPMPDKYKAEEDESGTSLVDYLKRFMQLPDLKAGGRAPTRAIATVGAIALIAGMMYSRDE
jgi:hypothetical protein